MASKNVAIFAIVATVGLLVPTPALAAPNVPEAPQICEPQSEAAHFTSHVKSNTITQKEKEIVATGTTGSRSITTTVETVVTASVSYNTSTKISAEVVIGSLEGTVNIDLAANFSKTRTTAETRTVNFNSPGTYIVFRGVQEASGNWTGTKCNSNGTAILPTSGKATSWSIEVRGTVNCASSVPAGSIESKAKTFC